MNRSFALGLVLASLATATAAALLMSYQLRSTQRKVISRLDLLTQALEESKGTDEQLMNQLTWVIKHGDDLRREVRNIKEQLHSIHNVMKNASPANADAPAANEYQKHAAQIPRLPDPFYLIEDLSEADRKQVRMQPFSVISRNTDGSTAALLVRYHDGSESVRAEHADIAMDLLTVITELDHLTHDFIDKKLIAEDYEWVNERVEASKLMMELGTYEGDFRGYVSQVGHGFAVVDLLPLFESPNYQALVEKREQLMLEFDARDVQYSVLH